MEEKHESAGFSDQGKELQRRCQLLSQQALPRLCGGGGPENQHRGGILQEAVNATLRRMPCFSDALVERKGDFYYAVNPLPFEVAETE